MWRYIVGLFVAAAAVVGIVKVAEGSGSSGSSGDRGDGNEGGGTLPEHFRRHQPGDPTYELERETERASRRAADDADRIARDAAAAAQREADRTRR